MGLIGVESLNFAPPPERKAGILLESDKESTLVSTEDKGAPPEFKAEIPAEVHQKWCGRQIFYKTVSRDLEPHWHIDKLSNANEIGTPTINEILQVTRKAVPPLRAYVDLCKYKKLSKDNMGQDDKKAHQLISSHLAPINFPVKAENWSQPKDERRGADNPLWATAYKDWGRLSPKDYHFPERFFPQTRKFTKTLPSISRRNCSLNTSITRSKVHKF